MLLRATQRALRRGARQKSTVVMMRHGESTWNLENKFTGEDRGAEQKRPSFFSLESEAATPSRGADRRRADASMASVEQKSFRTDAASRLPARRLVRLPFI